MPTRYIVELEPGLFLRFGPIRKFSMTTQRHKANRYDNQTQANVAIISAHYQEASFRQFKNVAIVEVTE